MEVMWSQYLAMALSWTLVLLTVIYIISGLDDLFIDLYAWVKRVRPRYLTTSDLEVLANAPQKNVAIIVPAWDEGSIIKRMLLGNRNRIQYDRYHFFVGCYPNDRETIDAVRDLELVDSRVHAIENFKDGPTCKGQVLNWVIDSILAWEVDHDEHFDVFLMHDSEDLIHERSLQCINGLLDQSDFVQLPVFSLDLRLSELVAGVYIDEFAEAHTKDVLVRSIMCGGVPSAGVGTAMSRQFVLKRKQANCGEIFRDGSLTEDYELGVSSGIRGETQVFAATWYFDEEKRRREFIATREFFPKSLIRSIRQKTRWTIGISLQGWRYLGWRGSLAQKYFLYRDRRGLITNPVMVLGYIWILLFLSGCLWFSMDPSEVFPNATLRGVVGLTGLFACNRIFQRVISVIRVYGWKAAILVPVRLPIGNLINASAVVNAVFKDFKARMTKQSLAWSKTHHELPSDFGVPLSSGVANVPAAVSVHRRS